MKGRFPITDHHIHIDPVNGIGLEAAKEFARSGGTHLFLVSKPASSFGVLPSGGESYRAVFDETVRIAGKVRETGLGVFPVLGVHPAEITRLAEAMGLVRAVEVMKEGLDLAARYVEDGEAFGIKSGRPHYPVPSDVWDASNAVLRHALRAAARASCAVQLHAESGPCADIVDMAAEMHLPIIRVIKHYASPDTPLVPSMIAKAPEIPGICRAGRPVLMESDYMDERTRPGAVIGPKSVPRFTMRLIAAGLISEEDAYRIHAETPSRIYGVEIG